MPPCWVSNLVPYCAQDQFLTFFNASHPAIAMNLSDQFKDFAIPFMVRQICSIADIADLYSIVLKNIVGPHTHAAFRSNTSLNVNNSVLMISSIRLYRVVFIIATMFGNE